MTIAIGWFVIWLIAACMVGTFLGVFLMCLLAMSSRAERDMQEIIGI